MNWDSHFFFMQGHFYFKEWMTKRQTTVTQTSVSDVMKWASCFREKNWQNLLPMTKFELSIKYFRKLPPHELYRFQIKMHLIKSMSIWTNVIFKYCINVVDITVNSLYATIVWGMHSRFKVRLICLSQSWWLFLSPVTSLENQNIETRILHMTNLY